MALSEEEHELWIRYLHRGDLEARDYLFLQYSSWARRIAGSVFARLRVPQLEWADFAQNAMLGLIEAMSRFDPDRGLDFVAYAKLRVRGAVFNGVRLFLSGTDRATDPMRFEDRLGSVTDGGRTNATDPLTGFADSVVLLGLGVLLEGAGPPDALVESRDESALKHRLLDAMERLPDRERLVLSAHYLDRVQFREIALHFGVTKGRISQVHKSALVRLRKFLASERFDPWDYL